MLYFLDALRSNENGLKGCSMTTANIRSRLDKQLRDTLREIIDGKTVKRSKHELMFGGIDVSNVFMEEMDKKIICPWPLVAPRATMGNVFLHSISRKCRRILARYFGKDSLRTACENSSAAS
jgi:hypothetical protein